MAKPIDIKVEAEAVIRQVTAIRNLYPDVFEGDDALLLDTLEGETNLNEVMDRLAEMYLEAAGRVEVLSNRIAKLSERHEVQAGRVSALRDLMLKILVETNVPTVRTPELTLSTRAGSTGVAVTDPTMIPEKYWVTKTTRDIDKMSLKRDVLGGEDVPGTIRTNGAPTLQIRR